MDLQLYLEEKFHKNKYKRRVKEYWKEVGLTQQVEEYFPEDHELIMDIVTRVYIHKRLPVGSLIGMFVDSYPLSKITETVEKMVEIKLIGFDGERLVTQSFISKEVLEELDNFMYPIPMVVEPDTVRTNQDCGYFTVKKNIVLRMKDSKGDFCLDHINTMNRIPLSLNASVVENTPLVWKNMVGTLEKDKKRQYDNFVKQTNEVVNLLTTQKKLYLTHSYDKRGRIYCNGYSINYQGCDWNKAAIHFADKELIDGY